MGFIGMSLIGRGLEHWRLAVFIALLGRADCPVFTGLQDIPPICCDTSGSIFYMGGLVTWGDILLQVKEDVTPYIVSRINLFNTKTHDNT